MPRRVVAIALVALWSAMLCVQAATLCDGELCVPVPSGWSVWSESDVLEANPDVPTGNQVLAMAGEHPFGHAGPNATMTLERLDLAMLDHTGMTSDQLAQMNRNQMINEAAGFVPRGEIFLTRLGNRFAHGWQGTLTIRSAGGPMHLLVWQVVESDETTAHRLTFFVPVDSPAQMPTEMPVEAPVEEASIMAPGWMVGEVHLDLPNGWSAWNETQRSSVLSHSRMTEPRTTSVNGISRVGEEGGEFQPSMVVASIDVGRVLTADDLLTLVDESAWTLAHTLSGEVTVPGTAVALGGREAAHAVVRGEMLDHLSIRPIRIDQIWIDMEDHALRVVQITDLDDDSTRSGLNALLEGMTL